MCFWGRRLLSIHSVTVLALFSINTRHIQGECRRDTNVLRQRGRESIFLTVDFQNRNPMGFQNRNRFYIIKSFERFICMLVPALGLVFLLPIMSRSWPPLKPRSRQAAQLEVPMCLWGIQLQTEAVMCLKVGGRRSERHSWNNERSYHIPQGMDFQG